MRRLCDLGDPDAERLASEGERLLDEGQQLVSELEDAEARHRRGEDPEAALDDVLTKWPALFERLVAHLGEGEALVDRLKGEIEG